jgi:mannose-6-phosphate isomerase-like protein (cupin superfamily)
MGHLVHLADVPEHAIADGRWQPLNATLEIRNFGINAVALDPGDDADIDHDERDSGHQEVYVVVSGRAAFRLGDEQVEAGPGDVVAVPDPAERRDYRALEPGTRIVCIGAGPSPDDDYGAWIARAEPA